MSTTKAKKRSGGFSLSALSTTRGQLFGIATLMVVYFHSYISLHALLPNTPVLADILSLIHSHCNKGVDMFLFMSGIGLYYSMSKEPRLRDFYKKRATRILPAVFIVSSIWFALKGSTGLEGYLSNLFFVSFLTEGVRYFWYFALIIFLYAIYPLIYKLYKSTGTFGMVTSLIMVITINILIMELAPAFYGHVEIALTRIPVFLIGAWIGKYVKEGVRISNLWLIVAGVVTLAIYVFYYFNPFAELLYIYRYMGGIFAIALTFLFSALFSRFSLGFVGTFLIWIGGYSMEIYLIQEKAASILYNSFHTNDPTSIAFYFAIFIISLICAIALKALTDNLDRNLFYRNANKGKKTEAPKAETKVQKEKELVHK